MQASPALFLTDFPFKVEAPAIIITTTANVMPRQGSLVARKGRAAGEVVKG